MTNDERKFYNAVRRALNEYDYDSMDAWHEDDDLVIQIYIEEEEWDDNWEDIIDEIDDVCGDWGAGYDNFGREINICY